jgi:cysteinyl-tRNA synthetase
MTSSRPSELRLYSTLSRTVEAVEPLQPGALSLYVCGMTVYDDAHIGHAKVFTVMDSFVRYLRHRGWSVRYVRNFTDVDDKIIARAAERGEDPAALAQRYIEHFHRDTDALGLLRPDEEPRVSSSIDAILGVIGKLVDKGHAYEADGSVWFSVPSNDAYGKLSGQKVDELRSPDADHGKRHSADFALWKAHKPGEPSWPSPWGPGRPGWHIECSAMCWESLGTTIDIHGGGLDLVFPHHENEVAQSECAHGEPFARYWMHNGLLNMASGQKMGKSLGNAIGIQQILEQYPAEALRLYYLQCHYRSPLPWDPDTALPEALGMLARLYEAREVAELMGGEEEPDNVARSLGADAMQCLELGRNFRDALYGALDDDFNTAAALGHAFELARAVNRVSNHKKAKRRAGPVVAPALEAFALLSDALGLMQLSTEDFHGEIRAKRLPLLGLTEDDVNAKLRERAEARIDRDWARADAIRDELEAARIVVMDTAEGGSEWRIRL